MKDHPLLVYPRNLAISLIAFMILEGATLHADYAKMHADDEQYQKPRASYSQQEPSPQEQSFASAFPFANHPWSILISGDFLYWKVKEEGLGIGLQSPNYTEYPPYAQLSVFKGVKGRISRINPEHKPGWRVGFDLKFPHDDWELLSSWTHYVATKHDSIHAKNNQIVYPYLLNLNFSPVSLSAEADWHLHNTVFDLDLARSFFAGKHLSLKPFAGFRAAWLKQNIHATYSSVTFSNSTSTAFIKAHLREVCNGYGIHFGLNSDWMLFDGFSLKGNLATALLVSEFDINDFEKNADHTPRTHVKNEVRMLLPVLELFGGFAWAHTFNDKFFLEFHAGWEEQIWFNFNQLPSFLNNQNIGATDNFDGNLSFSGLTLGAQIGF